MTPSPEFPLLLRTDSATYTPGRMSSGSATVPSQDPTLQYAPSYSSPLHDAVAWHLVKYLHPASGLQDAGMLADPYQAAPALDFLLEPPSPSRRIALVLTGPGAGPVVDEDPLPLAKAARQRDARLIADRVADVVYRIRTADAVHRLHDVLFLMAQWDGSLFSGRGATNLERLVSPEIRRETIHPGVHAIAVNLSTSPRGCTLTDTTEPAPTTLVLERLDRRHPTTWQPETARRTAA